MTRSWVTAKQIFHLNYKQKWFMNEAFDEYAHT